MGQAFSFLSSVLLTEAGSPGLSGAAKLGFENFVLAFEFQPTWSQGHCSDLVTQHLKTHGHFAKTHMSIHGMWPNYLPELHENYSWPQFCEEFEPCERPSNESQCQLQRLPTLLFNRSFLRRWPSYAGEYAFGDLATHEYMKHGSCTGMSQLEYFRTIEHLMVPLVKHSPFAKFVYGHIGQSVTWATLRDAFQASAGGRRVALQCNRQCQLSEAWLAFNATTKVSFLGREVVVPDMTAPIDALEGDTDTCEPCASVHLIDFDKEGCEAPAPAPPHPVDQCVSGEHGPACGSDDDCAGLKGCVRCAHSGYCTDVPLPGPSPAPASQCASGHNVLPCTSDTDCEGHVGCARCANSGFCTDMLIETFF